MNDVNYVVKILSYYVSTVLLANFRIRNGY